MTASCSIKEEHYSSANDLLEALTISAGKWLPDSSWNSPWVFRGQQDAEWGLEPKAWRTDPLPEIQRLLTVKQRFGQDYRYKVEEVFLNHHKNNKNNIPESDVSNLIEAYSQARAEFSLILDFLSLANELGHPVPGADQYIRLSSYDYIPDISNYPLVNFLPKPNSATALAQHHGIPTRAIDWTFSPLVAAFFAAERVQSAPADGKIAVWAIRPDLLKKYMSDTMQKREYCQFNSLECFRSDNKYLHAQSGLFIYPISACAYFAKNGCWPTIEEYATNVSEISGDVVIRKLTLSNSQASELLRLLWANGISRGHLMPTYDNVTKSLISKWEYWDH